jgi:hypothetical protein
VVYDLRHADDTLGDAVPKAELTLRVAIGGEEEESIEVE